MAAAGLLVEFYRDRGLILEPQRPVRLLIRHSTHLAARAKFYDEAGVALSLTGITVRYSLRDTATGTLVVNRASATLESQVLNVGEAFYAFTNGQVAASFEGIEEWELAYSGGDTESFPVGPCRQVVRILEDIDAI